MAENKTIEELLAEIEAKKEAERKARAKKKAAEAKADAEYKKKLETQEKYKKENMDRASSDSAYKRNGPQIQAGKAAKTRQRIERENKTNITNKYGQAYAKRQALLDSYRKTGDPKYKQLTIEADAALERVVADYVKIYGYSPPKYDGKVKYPEPPKPVVNPGQKKSTTNSGKVAAPNVSDARDAARSAGRNAAPAPVTPVTVAQSADPNVQRIIDAAAKAGIQLSVADAQAALGIKPPTGGGGYGSMASTRKQTTQYTLQQVRSAADSIYQNSIGRALNDDELRMLQKSLNTTLKENPNITKTSAKGNVTTSGGIDERGFMEQQAQANPEFASYQKATTYFDAMLNSLQGPVGGGI
jgi:hypothetical protein